MPHCHPLSLCLTGLPAKMDEVLISCCCIGYDACTRYASTCNHALQHQHSNANACMPGC